jgi:hypothetical protein
MSTSDDDGVRPVEAWAKAEAEAKDLDSRGEDFEAIEARSLERIGVRQGVSKRVTSDAGHLPCRWATSEMAVRLFWGWPASRTYKGWAWWARVKL